MKPPITIMTRPPGGAAPESLRPEPPLPPGPSAASTGPSGLLVGPGRGPLDRLERPLRDLRISVTDRCNFRCVYCMPREIYGRDFAFLPRSELLSFEEIVRVASTFVRLGVDKLRLTGGEPLVRRDLPRLVEQLAAIGRPDGGPIDLTMTTNGAALATLARPLAEAGLGRVTVSLDALDDATFRRMNDVDFPVRRVLDGIDAARSAGLGPNKVNAVIRRGLNEQEILPLARWARDEGLIVRYIEYMDVGHSNGWRLDDVVPADEIVATIGRELPLEPVAPNYRGEVARRYRFADGRGEIGVIASVTAPFCGDCTRARLSADGTLYTCLFSARGWDIRGRLRQGIDDDGLAAFIERVWANRDDRYSELRTEATDEIRHDPARVEMFAVGG